MNIAQRRRTVWLRFFSVSLVLTLSVVGLEELYAGRPPTDECLDSEGNLVQRRNNPELSLYARVLQDGDELVIEVNPQFYFLSNETQKWLFLRECARIRFGHDLFRTHAETNLREERTLDCEAVELVAESTDRYTLERDLEIIERDLNDLDSYQWREVIGGSRRRTDLRNCMP